MPRIAVAFFGITRSLTHTLGGLDANVIAPARARAGAAGDARLFAHLYQQQQIDNPRSGEQGRLDPDEHRLLKPDWLELEEPGLCLEAGGFEALKAFGDSWDDEFRSLRNLVHQLHSLDRVTDAVLEWGADVCIFARPDLRYHDSLSPVLRRALRWETGAWIPRWQPHGGLNDRFAVVRGERAIAAYGKRAHEALGFCEQIQGPLQGERLVRFAMDRANVPVSPISVRASRVRADGQQRFEEFSSPRMAAFKAEARPRAIAVADRLGLTGAARSVLKLIRP